MRMFTRSILTLTLTSTLILTALSEAAPRVRQAPPLLTPEETLCYGFGELTYDLALAREQGMPVLKTISLIREGLQGSPYAAALNAMLTGAAQDIYTYHQVSPDRVREVYTLACLLHRPFAPTTPVPAVTKKRY